LIFDMASSSSSDLGRAREASISAGVCSCPGSNLVFFFGGEGAVSKAPRFLVLRFAAFNTCFAIFSSLNMALRASRLLEAIDSGLLIVNAIF